MAQKLRPQAETLYGLPQPLTSNLFPPVIAQRNPSSADTGYPLGQTWDNKSNDTYWVLLSVAAGAAVWGEVVTNGGGTILGVPNGGTGDSTLTAHGVLIGEGVSPVHVTAAGTDGQVLTGATGADPSFGAIGIRSGLTAHGVILGEGAAAFAATAAGTDGQVLTGATGADPSFGGIGIRSGLTAHGVLLAEGASAFAATAAGATGAALMGNTGADPSFTGSPSFSGSVTAATTLTATLGAITATNGNLVAATSGTGLLLTPVTASGASPQTANGRVFNVTFTGVSIASGASQAFDIANTSIVGAGTFALVDWSGATAGSALSMESKISTAGHLTITMTNGTSATMVTSVADITFTGIVLN